VSKEYMSWVFMTVE